MALVANEFFSTTSRSGPASIIPHEGGVRPVTLSADPAATVLAVGTPLGFNTVTGFWEVWGNAAAGGADQVRAFVYPKAICLDAAGEVVGQALLDGEIDYNCIALPAGETQPNLDAALRDGPRALDLKIDNLSGVR